VGAAFVMFAMSCAGSPDLARLPRCTSRKGGAEIEIKVNNETFRLWSTNAPFISHAKELKTSGKKGTAMFQGLADGTDCDPRWTFHSDPADMSWPQLTTEVCDGRPSDVERDKAHWISDVKRWCPWGTEVLAVDER
jgi:hypothetical protein